MGHSQSITEEGYGLNFYEEVFFPSILFDMYSSNAFRVISIRCPILADLIWCVCVVSLYAVFLPIPSSMHKSLIVKSWSFIMSSFH